MYQISIEVQDTNDVAPVMNIATCNPSLSVTVNEGEKEDFVIHIVSASDNDATGTVSGHFVYMSVCPRQKVE